jgi:hypothetical protein
MQPIKIKKAASTYRGSGEDEEDAIKSFVGCVTQNYA